MYSDGSCADSRRNLLHSLQDLRLRTCLEIPLPQPALSHIMVYHIAFPTPRFPLSPAMSEEKEQTKVEGANSDHVTVESGDGIDEKKLLRKIDLHLLPWVTVLFLLSFLDRTNGKPFPPSAHLPPAHLPSVGNARIEGLATDLHMSTFLPFVYG